MASDIWLTGGWGPALPLKSSSCCLALGPGLSICFGQSTRLAMVIKLPEAKQVLSDDPYYLNIENRLRIISLYLAVAVTSLSLALGELTLAISFLVGAVLSFVKFSWMKQG